MKLGTSQQAVYEWLKKNGPATQQQVGDALYDTTSEYGKGAVKNYSATDRNRREWARRILKKLSEHGLSTKLKSERTERWMAVVIDSSLNLPAPMVLKIEEEVKMMLHAHRDGMRSRGEDSMKQRFDCREGFYGEAFGIMRCLAVLGHGRINQAVNTPENKANLRWWLGELERQVLKEENYPGAGGDDSGRCDYCLEHWGKDAAGRKRST